LKEVSDQGLIKLSSETFRTFELQTLGKLKQLDLMLERKENQICTIENFIDKY